MTGFDACRLYTALNNHFFQPNYDYFKYHGVVPLKMETFEKKRDDEKSRYERLAKKFHDKDELENFIVANLIRSNKRMWVGLLFGGEADEVYMRWRGRTQAIQYNLISEIKKSMDGQESFNSMFQCDEGKHPAILKAQMRGDLSLESFVVLDMCIGFVVNLEKKLGDDRNWLIVKEKTIKYRPFLERLNIPVTTLRLAVRKAIEEMGDR